METVDERVHVGAVFRTGRVWPAWFLWRQRRIPVERVTFTWSERQGEARLHYFAVTDGVNAYELLFNALTLVWVLTKVETQG